MKIYNDFIYFEPLEPKFDPNALKYKVSVDKIESQTFIF
jgi:hypothetical protein